MATATGGRIFEVVPPSAAATRELAMVSNNADGHSQATNAISGRAVGLAWIAWTLVLVLAALWAWRALLRDAIGLFWLSSPGWFPDSPRLVVPLLILVAYAPMLVVSALWLLLRRQGPNA